MATDNTKLNFLSSWDIDQLVTSGEVAVPSGTSFIIAVPSGLPAVPVFEVQLKVNGRWYQTGHFSTAGTTASQQGFYTYVDSGGIYITSTINGIARYYIWQDKVNY